MTIGSPKDVESVFANSDVKEILVHNVENGTQSAGEVALKSGSLFLFHLEDLTMSGLLMSGLLIGFTDNEVDL